MLEPPILAIKMLDSKPILFNQPKTSRPLSSKTTPRDKEEASLDQRLDHPEKIQEELSQQGISRQGSTGVPNLVKIEKQEEAKETEKLNHLARKTSKVLYQISNVFPFDPFPNQLIIDLHKITYIHHVFFSTKNVITIPAEELEEVSIETDIFFTAIRLTPRGREPILMKFLPRSKANEAGKILQGIVDCNKAEIDLTKLDETAALEKIMKVGEAHTQI